MTAILAVKFNTSFATSPIAAQTATSSESLIFNNSFETEASEADKRQLKTQAQELVRMAKGLDSESSKSLKKSIQLKMDNLKAMAEDMGININEIFSEIMENMSRKEQKAISKALKIKVSKKSAEASTQKQISNPFNTTSNKPLFAGFGSILASSRTGLSYRSSESFNANTNLPELKEVGYDEEKAKKLAQATYNSTNGSSIGYCAKYVSNAIAKSGLKADRGHAYQMAENLTNSEDFQEVSTKNLNLNELPAGCVLVWDRGVSGYSRQYGHIAVTNGDGTASSDFRQKRIPQGARVFVPV